MNKQEFLENLRLALNGRVSPGVVTENLSYYEDYINMEIRKGRSEEEVLTGLGDPRLLARTIVQTHGGGNVGTGSPTGAGRSGGYSGQTRNYSGQSYGGRSGQSSEGYGQSGRSEGGRGFHARIPGWILLILGLVVILLLVGIAFSVLSFLLPVLLPLLIVIFLVKLFRDWIN